MKKLVFWLLLLSTVVFALPKYQGFVNDFANVIDSNGEARLNALISDIEKNTTAEIAVITVKSLEGSTKEQLALQYLEEWGVGKKNDNGIVVLLAIDEKKYRIETGYGVEGVITDARAGRIGREMTSYLKNNRYGEGLFVAVKELGGLLSQDPSVVSRYSKRFELFEPFISPIVFISFLIFFMLLASASVKKTSKEKWVAFFSRSGTFCVILALLGFWIPFFGFIMLAVFFLIGGAFVLPQMQAVQTVRRSGWRGGFGSGRGSSGFGGFGGGRGGGGGAGGGW